MKSLIKGLANSLGYEIRRIPPPQRVPDFYRPHESCQIPTLDTLYDRVFGRRSEGYFVEVGAYDGESFSNISCLADLGWAGLLIEPVPEFAQKAAHRHSGNPAVKVIECAAGATRGTVAVSLAGPLSTADATTLDDYRSLAWAKDHLSGEQVTVPKAPLDEILEDNAAPVGFDLLVVDVEGFEREVFDGFSLGRWRPTMLIVELADYHPDMDRYQGDSQIVREIVAAGYEIIYKDYVNTVFRRCEPSR
jgi:FkbM family methyltransferase